MQNSLAYIFPAFTTKFTGKEMAILSHAGTDFGERLHKSEKLLGRTLSDFDINHNNYLNSELENQVISYNFCTAFSDILKTEPQQPAYISGFSLGLYAALYHAGAIDFETGVQLISEVFQQLKSIMGPLNYGMFSVIGFSRNDLETFIRELTTTEIVIQNGEYSYVLSGAAAELVLLVQTLHEQGALHLNTFDVSVPYHSKMLIPHKEKFVQLVRKYRIGKPQVPVVSMIDNTMVDTAGKAKNELVRNIVHPLNFMKSIIFMQQLGVRRFMEVGAGTSLLKSSKFIDGSFTFQAISKQKLP